MKGIPEVGVENNDFLLLNSNIVDFLRGSSYTRLINDSCHKKMCLLGVFITSLEVIGVTCSC